MMVRSQYRSPSRATGIVSESPHKVRCMSGGKPADRSSDSAFTWLKEVPTNKASSFCEGRPLRLILPDLAGALDHLQAVMLAIDISWGGCCKWLDRGHVPVADQKALPTDGDRWPKHPQ